MKRVYHTKRMTGERSKLAQFLASNEALFLPFLELIEESSSRIGGVLDEVNRALIEGLLELGGQDDEAVVAREGREPGVDLRVEPVGADDSGLEVVDDQGAATPPKSCQAFSSAWMNESVLWRRTPSL